MATPHGRLDPVITSPYEVTWLIKNNISPLPRGLCHHSLIHHSLSILTLWSCDQVITWLIKNVISQLSRDLWLLNLTEWGILMWTLSHKVTWQMKNVINSWLLANLKEGWLMIRSHMFNYKATYSFDHVVTWVHVTNELCYVFTSTNYDKL